MAHTPGQYEHVPDSMSMREHAHLVDDIEDNATGIGQATSQQPVEGRLGNGPPKASYIEGTGPAHAKIDHYLAYLDGTTAHPAVPTMCEGVSNSGDSDQDKDTQR